MIFEERMQAERACSRLIKRFAVLADQGRSEELSLLFTSDARFNRPSEPNRTLEGRQAIFADFNDRPHAVSAHLALNILVDVHAPGRATAISYILAMSGPKGTTTPEGFPLCPGRTRIGRFDDEFRFEAGEWLISRRVGRMLLVTGETSNG